MAQPGASTTAPRQQEVPRRPPGLLSNVFWHWPSAASWHVTRVADFQPDR